MSIARLSLVSLVLLTSAAVGAQHDYEERLAETHDAVAADPSDPDAYNQRGQAYFLLDRMDEAIADFDQEIKLDADREEDHWQRGVSQYFAGRYADCEKQFETILKAKRGNPETSLWHFACVAKQRGFRAAQKAYRYGGWSQSATLYHMTRLYLGLDPVYKVMAAMTSTVSTQTSCFYGNLYLAIYYDIREKGTLAARHMDKAVHTCHGGDYMDDIARLYAARLGGN